MRGVYRHIRRSGSVVYHAKVGVHGKLTHLGTFETETEAALAYNEAALRAFGEFAWLNKI